MFSNNQIVNESMMEKLTRLMEESTRLRIAVAYIGESAVIWLLPAFQRMVHRGATAEVFIGRALTEGLFRETLEICQTLHSILSRTGGGVYATQMAFHNKIYAGQIEGSNTAWIGSSNLSINGLTGWREANVRITAHHPSINDILNEIDAISVLREDLAQVPIVNRRRRRNRVGTSIDVQEYPAGPIGPTIGILELPLYSRETGEVQERSGLNWWNGRGRPRDRNEACIALSVLDIRPNLNFFPNNAHQGATFLAYTDDGFQIEMQIEGRGPLNDATGMRFGKQIASRPGKPIFGEWILRRKLNLPPGTLVTRQMLQNYGRETIEFRRINANEYIMRF